jgi:2-phospho-L-lactate guanylyltransferase
MVEPNLTWIVVMPVKPLSRAKTRLSTRPAGERRSLVRAFAWDTAAAVLGCEQVAGVVMVTDDPLLQQDITELGGTWIPDSPDSGLNAALRYGEDHVRAEEPTAGIAVVTCDLPALTSAELSAAMTAATTVDRGYVSDAAGTGTTLLTARPDIPLDPQFGIRSAAAHKASGAVPLDCGPVPGLRRDVDTEIDLWDARRIGVGVATQRAVTLDRDETGRG